MRIIRCFADLELNVGNEIVLPEITSNHLIRVLRLEINSTFQLFNGNGFEYLAKLTSIEKKHSKALILSSQNTNIESPLKIHLFQSIARGEKMDLILQKATELGVTAFTPIVSDRTEVKLDNERSEKKLNHWQGVIRSACEQSGRSILPKLHMPVALKQIAASNIFTQAYFLDPKASNRIQNLQLNLDEEIILAIGPEGGFSERDIELLQIAKFQGLSIGPRILRTETAGIAIIAALQSQFGDW
jgi:16S rRNA (uracil1498-N3)-methyltransferase